MKNSLSILILVALTFGGFTLLKFQLSRSGQTKNATIPAVTTSLIQVAKNEQPELNQAREVKSKKAADNSLNDPYKVAVDQITEMLESKRTLNFKRAVFLTENAYYSGKLDWNSFCSEIEKIKLALNRMIAAKNLQRYKTAGNWAVFSYMMDSIPENNYRPCRYDFENFMGDKDYESFMVSHLLKTKKGNCHSLPYLYKILANEANVEAFIATAPMHCFIKHKDEKGQWWNLELTSGTFSRTSFIMESFNVSDAGIESGLYMKPLSEKESVALCLSDLLDYYQRQKGIYYGSLVQKAYKAGLKVYPKSILQLAKRDDIKYRLDNAMKTHGLNDYHKIKPYPELVQLKKQLDENIRYIQKIGYSKLTPAQYKDKVLEIKKGQQTEARIK